MHPIPPCPFCEPRQQDDRTRRPRDVDTDSDVDHALAVVEEIQDLAEGLPDEGFGFGLSVTEKAADIAATIERHGRVSTGQLRALENLRGFRFPQAALRQRPKAVPR